MKGLEYWGFHTDKEAEFFNNVIEKFMAENPSIKVVSQLVPWDDYMGTKMASAFASGAGPDVFQVSDAEFLKYANSSVLAPLDKYIDGEVMADFVKSSLEGVTIDGKLYAIPYEIELRGLYYDIDKLKAAGVEPPKTWEELKVAAAKLKTDKCAGVTEETVRGGYQVCQWYPWMWLTGNELFTPDRKASALNSPGVIEGFKLWRSMFADGSANIKPTRGGYDIHMLLEEETAMQFCGSWAISTIEKDYPDKNIGVVPYPLPEGGKPATVAGGWKMTANAASKNLDEAGNLAAYMFAQKDNSNMLEWCTDVKFAYPTRKSVIEAGKDIYNKGLRKVFTQQIYGTEKTEMSLPPEIFDIVADLIQTAFFDESVTVEDAVKLADEKINDFLKTYTGN